MMTHYTLLQCAIPKEFMINFVEACNTHLKYFIAADDLLGEDRFHPISEIHEIFDLAQEEFKTIAIRINPYKRMVLQYVKSKNSHIDLVRKTGPNYVNYIDCKDFNEFIDLYLSPDNPNFLSQNSVNAAPFYIYSDKGIAVSYLLDFDTFNTDVRTIPEFASVADVNYFALAHTECEGYTALYSEASKLKVADVFALDIATWNYTFE